MGLLKNHQPDVHDGLGRNVLNLMNLQVETPEEFGFFSRSFTAKNRITELSLLVGRSRSFHFGSQRIFQGALFARFLGGGGHFFSAFFCAFMPF